MISLINEAESLDVMVVSTHPDDAEIGCGGLMAKIASQGHHVGIIDLTDGEPTPFTVDRDERLEEARRAGLTLGMKVREVLELPNRKLWDTFEARVALASRIRHYKPKILISTYGLTPHDSPDHYQGQLITEGGLFYARLSKWEDYFDGLPTHRVWTMFYYVTLREVPNPELFLPRFVVDVTNEFPTKVETLRCYESQFRANPNSPGVIPWVETMARYYGHQISKEYAELLLSPKAIELPGLDLWI